MASTEGGVDIEEVAEKTPEAIHKIWTHPVNGLDKNDASKMADSLGLEGFSKQELVSMLMSLAKCLLKRTAL